MTDRIVILIDRMIALIEQMISLIYIMIALILRMIVLVDITNCTASYDWMQSEIGDNPSGYMLDLVAFLKGTFKSFTNLPVSILFNTILLDHVCNGTLDQIVEESCLKYM